MVYRFRWVSSWSADSIINKYCLTTHEAIEIAKTLDMLDRVYRVQTCLLEGPVQDRQADLEMLARYVKPEYWTEWYLHLEVR